MSRRSIKIANKRSIVLGLVVALGACSKTGSPPGGFGVNVTVDATHLGSASLSQVTTDKLTVLSDKTGATPVVKVLSDLPAAIKGGTVRFHYTPGADVSVGERLTFGLDLLGNGGALVATGSAQSAKLEAGAISLTLTLSAMGLDGGAEGGTDGGKGSGVACVTDNDCGSGFCTDGVCCKERCHDVCASCALPGSPGTCTAYAADTDPEKECLGSGAPVSDDAGAPTSDAGTEAGAEGGAETASTDASPDANDSDAVVINTPDGGFMTMPSTCAGSCTGARACKFPDTTKTCGKPFCNSRKEVGTFVCDGNGGCAPSLSDCKAYACDDMTGACRTQCAAHLQCLIEDYCSGVATCLPKKANGLTCASGDECVTGACSGGFCCNTACEGPGLTCAETGHVGQCQCTGVTCAAGVACQVFYQDSDGDGFGNKDGIVGTPQAPSLTAKAGCMGSAPPAGYVADNTDCDDGDANAHVGQNAFFPTPTTGKHNFDYNCSGTPEPETPTYLGGSCKFCGNPGTCAATTGTCPTANRSGSFQCPEEGYIIPIGPILTMPIATTATTLATAPIAPLSMTLLSDVDGLAAESSRLQIRPTACCGCETNDKTAFLANVACGATGTTYTCSTCAAAGGGTAPSAPAAKIQRCH